MKYRKLGNSDLEVSEISLGSWLTYGVGVEADEARACLEEAFNQGINFIDTANVYGRGAAETFLGDALKGRPRDSYVLATKLFFPMSDSDRGLSRAQVEKQIDASLKRLQTDYVDLYQCHRYDWDTPLEETMEALNRAVESGKTDISASRSGRQNKSRRELSLARNAGSPASYRASRNIPCCGASPSPRSSRSALPTAYRRSSGRPWDKACSAANTTPTSRRPPELGRRATRWVASWTG